MKASLLLCGLSLAAFHFNPCLAANNSPAPDESGLAALRAEGQAAVDRLRTTAPEGRFQPSVLLDRVAAQKDAHTSGLFWHTDLDAALAEAKRLNRPVLSLRLLGRLDEELSCANSRMFRALLYADPAISRQLRSGYVLHWESVRPVPIVTIDFGDGRRLVRTLTGNSIHYILAPDGTPLDALPGLWSPQAFLQALQKGEQTAKHYAGVEPSLRRDWLKKQHDRELRRVLDQYRKAVSAAGLPSQKAELIPVNSKGNAIHPSARDAGRLALSKIAIEQPLLRASGILPPWDSDAAPTSETLRALADAWRHQVAFSKETLGFIREKSGEQKDNEDFSKMVESLRDTVAADTVVNTFQLRPRILEWLAKDPSGGGIVNLNNRVYDELFLTPASDPWLGLAADGRFSGLNDAEVSLK